MATKMFSKATGLEGKTYQDGDLIDDQDIPEGSRRSLELLGVLVDPPAAESDPPSDEPATDAKTKKK